MQKFAVFIILLLSIANTGTAAPLVSPASQNLDHITLPPGFEITVFSNQVPGARSLEWTPGGTLFVGTRYAGNVYALRDEDGDFVADRIFTIASGLVSPNGVAFKDGSLYVAEVHRILRYDDIENRLADPPAPEVVFSGLPTGSDAQNNHGWKFIRFGPDGKLYIPIGAPCNSCLPGDPRFGTIVRINPDGTDFEVYAQGIRNTVGFDWHPLNGELWFTDNGHDRLGNDVPPDELNQVTAPGQHFGFPYCHGGDIPDPEFGSRRSCGEFVPPAAKLGPHVAALGMRFYTGEGFPQEYRNQIFIAEHGSVSRSTPIGYRVTLVRLDEMGRAISYEPFAEGWLRPDNSVLGRPVDLEELPDGSLLVSDDRSGAIYRIAYVEEVEEVDE